MSTSTNKNILCCRGFRNNKVPNHPTMATKNGKEKLPGQENRSCVGKLLINWTLERSQDDSTNQSANKKNRCWNTLPETNIAPEIHPWKRSFLLETIIFGCYVSFGEGKPLDVISHC